MKKILFTLLVALIASVQFAQAQCTPQILTEPGLSPDDDSLACIERTVPYSNVIYFQNFDEVTVSGVTVTVNWLKIKEVNNIPCDLVWVLNDPDSTYNNQENGCIDISGTTMDNTGQYNLQIIVDVNVSVIGTLSNVDASEFGFGYSLRVIEQGQTTCDPGNTTSAGLQACNSTGIPLAVNPWSFIGNSPNPFSESTTISFVASQSEENSFMVFNSIGELVYSEKIETNQGLNTKVLAADRLTPGIYFYRINNYPLQKMIVSR